MYKKFEYKTIIIKPESIWTGYLKEHEIDKVLNEYGQQGWELISTRDIAVAVGLSCIFKRQIN